MDSNKKELIGSKTTNIHVFSCSDYRITVEIQLKQEKVKIVGSEETDFDKIKLQIKNDCYAIESAHCFSDIWDRLNVLFACLACQEIVIIVFHGFNPMARYLWQSLFHCPGKNGEFRGLKCVPESKRDHERTEYLKLFVRLIAIEKTSFIENLFPDRPLATDGFRKLVTWFDARNCVNALKTISKLKQQFKKHPNPGMLQQWSSTNIDNKANSVDGIMIDIREFILVSYQLFPNSPGRNWIDKVASFFGTFQNYAENSFFKRSAKTKSEIIASAYYVVHKMSLADMDRFSSNVEQLDLVAFNIVRYGIFLLENPAFARSLSEAKIWDETWYNEKLEILKSLAKSFEAENCSILALDDKRTDQQPLERTLSTCAQECNSFSVNIATNFSPILIDPDGNMYDGNRDPPGQRSVYIPPGDQNAEAYRLSTFIKFPDEIPANPRHLASSGFYYTGYRDRVKCFSCGICVENWEFGDDVTLSKWHRSECDLANKRECGNIAIRRFPEADAFKLSNFETATMENNIVVSKECAKLNDERGSVATPRGNSPPQTAHVMETNHTSPHVHVRQTVLAPPNYHVTQTNHVRQTARSVPPQMRNYPLFQNIELATIGSAYHENFLRNLDLRKESERIRTYEHWPTDRLTVRPNDLAKSGFFYLGNLDRVQCFSCGGVLRNWNYGDSVQSEHRRHFSNCMMVNSTENRNVPLTEAERSAEERSRPTFTEPPDPSEEEARDLRNMFPCQYPVNPHMRNDETRMETFDHRWPAAQVNATPGQISKAGFFSLGDRDRVKCWYCNGGLQNWDPEDEPWTEHAKWFPTCEFLLQRKGPDFVHRMVSMFPNLPRPLLRGPFDVPPPAPGARIAFGSSSSSAPSPPPTIIDPQADLRREREKLRKALNSEIVKNALDMGFDRKVVTRVVKRRISHAEMYTSVTDLVDAVINDEVVDDDEEDEDEIMTSQTNVTKMPGTSSNELQSIAMETEEQSPSMQARIRELQEERKCKICLDKDADIVFVPCGHLCSCGDCAQALRKCPMCRKKIEKGIRTYMS